MHRLIFILLFALSLSAVVVNAQGLDFTANGFRGLEIDKASPEDVVRVVGPPTKSKEKATAEFIQIEKWLENPRLSGNAKRIAYKKIADFQQMDFFFVENKLVLIDVTLYDPETLIKTSWRRWERVKTLVPDDLEPFLGAKFKPFNRWHFPETPADFEKYSPKPFRRDDYKMQFYSMVSITPRTFIACSIASIVDILPGKELSIFKQTNAYGSFSQKIFPGQVRGFQIISRVLEKR